MNFDISPDDTQPSQAIRPVSQDTQPSPPIRQLRQRPDLILLAAVIVIIAASLGLTLLLTLVPPLTAGPTPTPSPEPNLVRLAVAGEMVEIHTYVETVGELLVQQGIVLNPQDALSHSLDALVQDEMTITIDRARDIELVVDGVSRVIRTPFDNPHDIVSSQAIMVDADDRVWVDGTQTTAADLPGWPVPVQRIEVTHAYPVTIEDENGPRAFVTTAQTVGDALFEANVTLYVSDEVSPGLTEPVRGDLTIQIIRARPIMIEADEFTFETRVQGKTVAEALAESGVILAGLDYAIPAEATRIVPGMTIQVIRVTETLETEREIIPYETIYQPDNTLELDTRSTLQAGQSGIVEVTIRIRHENGVEISREQISSVVISETVNEIIAYGTQVIIRTVDTPNGPLEYWRVLPNILTTSYHPAALGGDDVTAIGMKLTKGIVGADPTLIPYRTRIYVPGYGEGIIADTGGPRSTRYWIDLGYDDENYIPWRRFDTRVYLLTPVPENINYLLPPR